MLAVAENEAHFFVQMFTFIRDTWFRGRHLGMPRGFMVGGRRPSVSEFAIDFTQQGIAVLYLVDRAIG